MRIARILLAASVVVAVLWAVLGQWGQVQSDFAQISWPALLAAGFGCAGALFFSLLGWRVVLADLGSPLGLGPAAGVFFPGQLGKYLPGSVWTIVAQMEIAAALGVPRKRTSLAGMLSIGLNALAGLMFGVLALPSVVNSGGSRAYIFVACLLPIGLAGLHPKILTWGMNLGLKIARKPSLTKPLSGPMIAQSMGFFSLGWLFFGGHIWFLAIELGADASQAILPAVCGYALAATLGMLAIFLPAGAGLRELMIVLLFGPILGPQTALSLAIISRLVVIISDIGAAVVGYGYSRRHHLLRQRLRG